MRALIQRVREASVSVDGREHGRIGTGCVIFLGVRRGDTEQDAILLAGRCAALRIFNDAKGKMNLSVQDVDSKALVVSQFTLYADTRRGNRPGFSEAATPGEAEHLYRVFLSKLREQLGENRVAEGVFGAHMVVTIANDGPVTILIERPDPGPTSEHEK